ncbi:uncharacterized protein [Haliotis cracherodii]|uniref:uncharacterized protein isoform X2 n=1 Tax=Haliotis cracherodii TaxID=6455 RepID=UPI0039E968DE
MENYTECINSDCVGIGVPAYHGRCQMCHHAHYNPLPEISISDVSQQDLTVESDPVAPFKCLIENCPHFGSLDKGHLCNECYNTHPHRCNTLHCENVSLAKNDYLCEDCLEKRKKYSQLEGEGHSTGTFQGQGHSTGTFQGQGHSKGTCSEDGASGTSREWSYVRPGEETQYVSPVWRKCLTAGCGNSGTSANGLCLQCYLRQVDSEGQVSAFHVCPVTGCNESGYQKLHGFCRKCYSAGKIMDKMVIKKSSVAEHAQKGEIKCTTPNCDFFGLEEQNGQCSSCFNKYLDTLTLGATSLPQTAGNHALSSRCRTPGCEFFGTPERHDLCSSCFRKTGRRERSRHASGPPGYLNQAPALLNLLGNSSSNINNVSSASGDTAINRSQVQGVDSRPGGPSSRPLPGASDSTNTNTLVIPDIHEPVNSDELFGEGPDRHDRSRPTINMKRSYSSPSGFTVSEKECQRMCGRKCVAECEPYCMSCYEDLKLQPPSKPQQHLLGSYSRADLRFSSNPSLSSLSDVCESPGCDKPVSGLAYPLCQGCAEQSQESKARPNGADGGQDQNEPEAGEGEQTDGLLPEKKMISLKPLSLLQTDLCSIQCDFIICLWNKRNIETGNHPLLDKIGEVTQTRDVFKTSLSHNKVFETSGGLSKAGSVFHCKYDHAVDIQVANALLRCVKQGEAEASKKATQKTTQKATQNTITLFPVAYMEDLRRDPAMSTRVSMYVISYIQSVTGYTQMLSKFWLCVDSVDTSNKCKEEYIRVKEEKNKDTHKTNQSGCHQCKNSPAAKLKPLSEKCTDHCAVFCIQCLKIGRRDRLHCPRHGPCFSPIGHENTYAILVAGLDKSPKVTELFVKDAEYMSRALQSEDIIGIRKENIRVITPATEGSMNEKVMKAFSALQKKIHQNQGPSFFYFFYSGHNDKTSLKLGKGNDTISPRRLKRELSKLDVEEIVIILDCCYSAGADMTVEVDEEDFSLSIGSCSKDDTEPEIYVPKLWNLEETEESGSKGGDTCVSQWSSSMSEEKSYFGHEQSFFTCSIVKALNAKCPLDKDRCGQCQQFRQEVMRADGVFLKTVHESVDYHVQMLAQKKYRQQRPQLEGNHDDVLLAFHRF